MHAYSAYVCALGFPIESACNPLRIRIHRKGLRVQEHGMRNSCPALVYPFRFFQRIGLSCPDAVAQPGEIAMDAGIVLIVVVRQFVQRRMMHGILNYSDLASTRLSIWSRGFADLVGCYSIVVITGTQGCLFRCGGGSHMRITTHRLVIVPFRVEYLWVSAKLQAARSRTPCRLEGVNYTSRGPRRSKVAGSV